MLYGYQPDRGGIGYHDDLIMGLAIAHYIKTQMRIDQTVITPRPVFRFESEKPDKEDFGSSIQFI